MPKLTKKQQRKNDFLSIKSFDLAIDKLDLFVENYGEGLKFSYVMSVDLKEEEEREHIIEDHLEDYEEIELKEIATLLIMNYLIDDESFSVRKYEDKGWNIFVGKCGCGKDIHCSIYYKKPEEKEEPTQPEKEEDSSEEEKEEGEL